MRCPSDNDLMAPLATISLWQLSHGTCQRIFKPLDTLDAIPTFYQSYALDRSDKKYLGEGDVERARPTKALLQI